ncbi:Uncharacterised protein [Pluralibacter gergoviae]|nr:Uncharacterised protein [Pluralibacter gergoviae]
MRFTQGDQPFQQIPLPVDIAHRLVREQLGFSHFNGQAAALGQQGEQLFIQSADFIAQRQ